MKPILFNTEMVKAILDGRKTQTRRVIKIKNKLTRDWAENTGVEWIKVDLTDEKYPYSIREQNGAWNDYSLEDFIKKYSQYKVDDVLYIRETFIKCLINDVETILYKADGHTDLDGGDLDFPWTPSIHMPKKYARIFLKVTKVKVERLQDISSSGYISEGFDFTGYNTFTNIKDCEEWWINLWNSTAKDGYKWEDNPYVFVYEFERVENIYFFGKEVKL